MVDEKYLITALIAVPMLILLAITVTNGLVNGNRVTFENTVNQTNSSSYNGTTNCQVTGCQVMNSTYDCKLDSVSKVSNGTGEGTLGIQYNVTYDTWGKCHVTSKWAGSPAEVYYIYTAYKDTADLSQYTSYKNIITQTNAGQKLSAMVPYVLIAIAIITIILGAFGISKLM